MNELDRCSVCDGWGWVKDPVNEWGEELPCPGCSGSGRYGFQPKEKTA